MTPLLQVRDLKHYFPLRGGLFNRVTGHVRAVDGISFDVQAGECLALVGESGSGKTTAGRAILRAMRPTGGQVLFTPENETVDLATAGKETLRGLRRHMQMIFQDPYASLNPRMTAFDIVSEPLLLHGVRDRRQREARVRELFRQVGLPEQHLLRYPHAFSGGQRQRIGIARALALQPKLIVADEPVSALDVSVQAQVLNLLRELQRDLALTFLFITHDLSIVRYLADRVAVIYVGRIVELSPVESLFTAPQHPYTEALLSAVMLPDPARKNRRILLTGEVADPRTPPSGCPFHPRCRYRDEHCRTILPELHQLAPGRYVRCHRAHELKLRGMKEETTEV